MTTQTMFVRKNWTQDNAEDGVFPETIPRKDEVQEEWIVQLFLEFRLIVILMVQIELQSTREVETRMEDLCGI
jgi:hypothetical protein